MHVPTNSTEQRTKRLLAVLCLSALTACTSTPSSRPSAHIEIQEDVGFTITEQAKIGSNVRADYETALTLLEQGRHDEGMMLLKEVAEQAPQFSAPRIDLGVAYHRAGDLEAAERNLLAALDQNFDHPIAHNELGIIYRKTGRFSEARQAYENALAVYPGYHFARRNLAILCDLYLADLPCALENYEAYMTTVPSDNEASMWITDLRNRTGQ